MKKRLLIPSLISSSFLLPISVVSCSNETQTNNDKEQTIYNDLLLHYIDTNKIDNNINIRDDFNPFINNENVTENDYVFTQANQLNMFKILFNQDWIYSTEDNNLSLDSVFYINKKQINEDYEFSFSFDYVTEDSFGNQATPTIASDKKTVVIPTRVSLVDKKTNLIVASKFVNDLFKMKIIETPVNNFDESLGFNGQPGKTIIYENNKKSIKFMDIPLKVIDPYLDLIEVTTKDELWMSKIIYNQETVKKWDGKTFLEVKSSVSNAFINPPNLNFKNKSFYYVINDSSFDQHEWNYPRFYIEFKQSNLDNIINTDTVKKYGLNFYKRYTYIDKSYKFSNPTESEISSAAEKNNKIASSLSNLASSSTSIWYPTPNFSSDFINKYKDQEDGMNTVVDILNKKSNKGFIVPEPFKYNIFCDDYRIVSFEIETVASNSTTPTTLDVTIKIKVGQNKLTGSANFLKKFNTKTWNWE